MIQIYLRKIHCHEETDEVGADEPYVLVTAVDLAPAQGSTPRPPRFDVVRYGFDDVDDEETHQAPGASRSFWGTNGKSAPLSDPDSAIFIVSLMERDSGNPDSLRTIVKGAAGAAVLGTLGAPREDTVAALLRDVRSAMGTPTGFPNLDDVVGVSELRFTADELRRAEAGQTVQTSIHINGDGGRYELTFETRNPDWQGFELSPRGSASTNGGIAAVSRIPSSMEMWFIGADGSVQDRFWYEGRNWEGFTLAPRGSASTSGSITAVSRIPGSMEVWWIGDDGSVQAAYWYEGQNWQRYQLAPAGSASKTGSITSVSRIPGSMELWWIGADGLAQAAY
jgi:hypothetical protein